MHVVKWPIIIRSAVVHPVSVVIRLNGACLKKVSFNYRFKCLFVFFYSHLSCMFLSSTFFCGIERPIYNEPPANPCLPSPCGPHSNCRVVGHTSACSCLPNYIGRPPQCRPECTINTECSANLACINERCQDPCVGSCGVAAVCNVVNHSPICTCQYLFTGDPFSGCYPVPSKNSTPWKKFV